MAGIRAEVPMAGATLMHFRFGLHMFLIHQETLAFLDTKTEVVCSTWADCESPTPLEIFGAYYYVKFGRPARVMNWGTLTRFRLERNLLREWPWVEGVRVKSHCCERDIRPELMPF